MSERYGDIWVCQDCYFAHHYGAYQREFEADDFGLIGPDGDDDLPGYVQLWYAGEDDEPVGGWHEIRYNHTLDHNREPLGMIGEGFEVADNTCSNHQWDREHECPVCDDGYVVDPEIEQDEHFVWTIVRNGVECWVCDGFGKIYEPCSECGQDSDENGIQEFSWSSCDGCHSPLGGGRWRLSLWKREEVTT